MINAKVFLVMGKTFTEADHTAQHNKQQHFKKGFIEKHANDKEKEDDAVEELKTTNLTNNTNINNNNNNGNKTTTRRKSRTYFRHESIEYFKLGPKTDGKLMLINFFFKFFFDITK